MSLVLMAERFMTTDSTTVETAGGDTLALVEWTSFPRWSR